MDLPVAELASAHGRCIALRVDADARTPAPSIAVPDVSGEVALAALHPDEQRAAAALAPARRRDWIAGRAAMRAALHRLDPAIAAGAIEPDDRGAPRLPAGWVGSISHKRGLALALAAPDDGWTLGVDLEVDQPSRIDISRRVVTPAEAAALDALDSDEARGRAVMLRFSIKEAIYKAIDPYLRRYVGFLEVEVWPDDAGGAQVTTDLPVIVEAGWHRAGGLLIGSARARRR
jgi:enterobactin synthetase component D